ncbi:hypothetical protein [Roseomonas chloroacetimidivorans]|uniref:hypothetical protein n=1 Tax=Roseomonas chloroacetimidivorans TaxID=1766656 RepID=UPI003C7718E7
MSTTLLPARTRDGGFSVAAALQAAEEGGERVRIDVEGARAWAKANGVHAVDGRLEVGRVNARRAELGLPLFQVVRGMAALRMPQDSPSRQETPMPSPSTAALDHARREAFGAAAEGSAGKSGNEVPATATETAPHAGIPHGAEDLAPIAATEDEFLDLVLTFNGTKTGLVTPALAGWALKINTANRPMNHKAVDGFVRILKEGRWHLTGEPAICSRDGILSDGQHRLEAIRRSGIAAPLDIRFGIERAAFVATGRGMRRTAGAILSMAGERFASSQAGIARLLAMYDAGQMARYSGQIEPDRLMEIVQGTPDIRRVAEVIQRHRFAPARTAPFGMVLVVALRHHPEEKVFEFAELVNSGRAPEETDPAYQLHLRLRDALGRKERIAQIDAAALAVIAFNARVRGKALSRLHLPDASRTNEGFPRVVLA